MPVHRLRSASGPEVCALLNALTDAALVAADFSWGSPHHHHEAEEEAEIAEEEGVEEAPRLEVIEEAEIELEPDPETEMRLMPLLLPEVSEEPWLAECAKVASRLKVQLLWSQGHWRHRLAVARQQAPHVVDSTPQLGPSLDAIAASANDQRRLVSPLQTQYDEAAASLSSASLRMAEAQQRLSSHASELSQVESDIERVRKALQERGEELSSASPLNELRWALQSLRTETRGVILREGFLQHELLFKRQQRLVGRRYRLPGHLEAQTDDGDSDN